MTFLAEFQDLSYLLQICVEISLSCLFVFTLRDTKRIPFLDLRPKQNISFNQVKNESRASYNFRNVYFMDEMLETHEHGHFKDIPPYLHMLQHVYR